MASTEILFFGRGGQGAVTSASLLAKAAHSLGMKGVQAAPSFGPERRGAPVSASLRISDETVRERSKVSKADIVVALDPHALEDGRIGGALRPGGVAVVNAPPGTVEIAFDSGKIAWTDASGIARSLNILASGQPVSSTAILGGVCAATDIVPIEAVEEVLRSSFPGDGGRNAAAARKALETTVIFDVHPGDWIWKRMLYSPRLR